MQKTQITISYPKTTCFHKFKAEILRFVILSFLVLDFCFVLVWFAWFFFFLRSSCSSALFTLSVGIYYIKSWWQWLSSSLVILGFLIRWNNCNDAKCSFISASFPLLIHYDHTERVNYLTEEIFWINRAKEILHMLVCVCVHVCEIEREREKGGEGKTSSLKHQVYLSN